MQEWMKNKPENCYLELSQLLASCGIAIIILPPIDNSFIHGATFLDGSKVVMGLYECGEKEAFWFNLFHEIAHVIYGHIEKNDGISDEDEKQAEEYARRIVNIRTIR